MDIQCGIDKGISHMYVGDIPKVKTLKIEDIPIYIAKGISHTKPGISLRNRGYPPKNGDIPLVNLPDDDL